MKVFGYILMVISLLIGVLVDMNYFEEVQLPIFSSFIIFLTGIFIQGMGMTLLQTASNPYITILGPIDSAAKRIAIMGIANKVAGNQQGIAIGW